MRGEWFAKGESLLYDQGRVMRCKLEKGSRCIWGEEHGLCFFKSIALWKVSQGERMRGHWGWKDMSMAYLDLNSQRSSFGGMWPFW